MIVRNIAPAQRSNENVPKKCLGSQKAAYAKRCLKEVPMLVGAILFQLAPFPTIFPASFAWPSQSIEPTFG